MGEVTRRTFVKAASGAVIGGAVLQSTKLSAAKKHMPLGIQLYTLRDLLAKDFNGTLKQVASAGFREVEAAGYYGRTAQQFKNEVDAAGMRCVSVHHPLADLLAKQEELIQYGRDLGIKYLICSAPRSRDGANRELTLDDWKWNFEQFNRLGEKTRAAGIEFGYHNHVSEFKKLDGVLVYDEMLRATEPHLVTMEMDCGWVAAAGFSPVEYLRRYRNRYSLLHVKDVVMKKGEEPRSTELGHGSIDYAPIFAAGKDVQHYFYEQEEFDIPAMEALRISAAYLRKLDA